MSGFVEIGSYWVRSSEIVRIQPTAALSGRTWVYGVQADLRHDGRFVTFRVSEAPDDTSGRGQAEQAEAKEARDTYLLDLLDRIRVAETGR